MLASFLCECARARLTCRANKTCVLCVKAGVDVYHRKPEKQDSGICLQRCRCPVQASLTGNGARVAVVCTITPASSQAEETHNTLKFATRAKKVGTFPACGSPSSVMSSPATYQFVIAIGNMQRYWVHAELPHAPLSAACMGASPGCAGAHPAVIISGA